MEEKKHILETIYERAEEYARLTIKLYLYRALDKTSEIVSSVITRLIIYTAFFIFFIFLNIAVGFLIGDALGKAWYGFGVLAGFYCLVGIILSLLMNKWIKKTFSNAIIRGVLNNNDES